MNNKIKRYPQRAIHLDFHTMPKVDDVGADFNGKEFAGTLKNAHVDSVTVFAKCNLGFAYYPTKVGIPHPGLQCDLLGGMVEACHKEGIMVLAYFNAGLDHENAIRHRDWCVLPADGTIYKEDKLDNFFRKMCLNTGYGDYLIEMAKEVLNLYPVDGLFFDCFNISSPCHGIECLKTAETQGKSVTDKQAAKEVLNWSNINFAARVKNVVPEEKLLYFNGIPFKDQLPYCGHFEIECLPQSLWGYDNFPANVRYTRNLGKHAIGQTGRFQGDWGDFGGIRALEALKFDCCHAISNAVVCGIGDHMHPRGKLDNAVYGIIGNIYAEIAQLEPWTSNVKAIAEIGVLIPQKVIGYPVTNLEGINNPVAGAVRMLTELKYQVDVVDWDMDFLKYKVLIMPDNVFISERHKDKLKQYIESGNSIISSGNSGLREDKVGFALPDSWGIEYDGEEKPNVEFFETVEEIGKDIPHTPVSIYDPGISVTANKYTDVLAYLWDPYFNKHWDGYHGYYYIPPKQKTNRPALTRNSNLFHFSFPVFEGYYEHAYLVYRNLVRNCIEKLLPDPLIKTEGIPSFARVTLTEKDNLKMIHILSYVPELRGKKQIIEEPILLKNVSLFFRQGELKVKNIYMAPSKKKLEFKLENGYIKIDVPEINGYQVIVIEN